MPPFLTDKLESKTMTEKKKQIEEIQLLRSRGVAGKHCEAGTVIKRSEISERDFNYLLNRKMATAKINEKLIPKKAAK